MLSKHELSDASALKILWAAIALVVGSIVNFIGVGALFFLLKSDSDANSLQIISQNNISQRLSLLEINYGEEYKARLAKEKHLLESYEWLDRDKHIARIPIKQAIEILVHEQR